MMRLVVILALSMLVACGNAAEDGAVAKQLWSRVSAGQQPQAPQVDVAAIKAALTPDVLAQIGGPVLIAEIPVRAAVAAMSRVGQNGDVETFLTQDGVSLSVRGGIVVATRGLGFDLMTADVDEPLIALRDSSRRAVRIHRYLDGENHVFARSFVCSYRQEGAQTVIENCRSPAVTFENSYTFDSGNVVRSSRQWISPEIGYVVMELFEN